MATLAIILAQAPPKASTATVLVLAGALIGCVMVLTIVVMLVRSRALAKERDSSRPAGALDELRALLKSGKISQQEFDAAKTKIAARLKGSGTSGARITPPGPNPGPNAGNTPKSGPNSDSGKSLQ
jgi:hypothetical protein